MFRPALLLIALLTALLPSVGAGQAMAGAERENVLKILQMVDYIGVDYPEFVQDGEVLDAAEYAEQVEFAGEIRRRLGTLPERPERAALRAQAEALGEAIDARAGGARIQTLTAELSRGLLRHYPVPAAPDQAPVPAAGGVIYATACASCHGAEGRGDGPAGAGLEPAPTNFHDAARRDQRSLFSLYSTITLGVDGTGMPSFAQLSEAERWDLAAYVGSLGYTQAQRETGERLVDAVAPPAAALDSLAALAAAVPAELAAEHGSEVHAVMAYLRANPQTVAASVDGLSLARRELGRAMAAYADGETEAAAAAALSAYLDGFELVEAQVSAVDRGLVRRIEGQMAALRQAIRARAAPAEVAAIGREALASLEAAEGAIAGGASAVSSFVGSFLILGREGLEAILVLAAIFAFLRKSGREHDLPYVHAGWIAALLLGVGTWLLATYVIDISGAQREITEGVTALLAAGILVFVGLWMHNKSFAGQWQRYVARSLQAASGEGARWALVSVSFLAVYREVFETVLFYRALWAQGEPGAILAGAGVAAVLLVGIAIAVFRYSVRLPITQFFTWTSRLIAVLAVILAGKGMAALQEAGIVPVDPVAFISLPVVGLYANAQALALQALLIALVLFGSWYNRSVAQRRDAAASR